MRTRSVFILALALMAGSSCTSATKRLEQGQQLEQQGRRADAARRYIDALRKDASLVEARQRLFETGSGALDDYARETDNFAAIGNFMDAADAIRSSDALVRDANGVGVALAVRPGYGDRRRVTFDRATDQAMDASSAAVRRGDFVEAVRVVERAQERWEPAEYRLFALNRTLYDAQMAWSQSELASSHYRSAYGHAQVAVSIPGFAGSNAEQLRAEALRRGTIITVAFPVTAHAGIDSRILPELNDDLAVDHWAKAPQWVGVINTIEALRAVRNRGLAGRELSNAETGALARQLGGRYGVALTLDSVRFSELRVERRRVAVKTRAGVDTAYTVEDGQLEMWARVAWRVVEAGGSNVVNRGDAADHATTRIHRGVYAGNWHDLDLPSQSGALFDVRNPKDDQTMQRQLARSLADRLGRDVFDALLRRVE